MRGATRKLWKPKPSWFWARVDFSGPQVEYVEGRCWLWNRTVGARGYGNVRQTTLVGRQLATLLAHRVAWALENGEIPEGRLVLHRCDVRACCRPSHLFLGDDQANVDDMVSKRRGRKAHGQDQHLAKLTERAVREIRQARAKTPPTPLKELARRYGVSLVAVSCVALGKTWKHVT